MTKQPVSMRRAVGASVVNLAYLAVQSLMFIIVTPLLLKVWGAEGYGMWVIMLAVMRGAELAVFGMDQALVKYVAQFSVEPDAGRKISGVISFSTLFLLFTGLASCAIVWVLRDWIALNIFAALDVSELAGAFGLIAIGLVPLFLSQVPLFVLFGLVYNELAGGLKLGYDVFLWGGALTIGLLGGSILDLGWLLLLLNGVYFFLTSLVAFWVLRPFNLRFEWNMPLIKELLHYGFYAWIISIGIRFYQQVDRILVGLVLGAALAGVYGIATGIAARLTRLASQFSQVLLPFASSYQVKDRLQEIRTIFRHASRLVACLMVLASSAIVIWMDIILELWISPQYSYDYTEAFRVLLIIYAFHSVMLPALRISLGLGWIKVPTIVIAASSIAMLVVLWVISQYLGLMGAVIANAVYIAVVYINFYTAGKLDFKPVRTVLADIGPPLVVLLAVLLLSLEALTIFQRALVTIVVAVIISWMALSSNRARLIYELLRPN